MSFRQRKSTWPGAPEQKRKELEEIGLPPETLLSESIFIAYLTLGGDLQADRQLKDLSPVQFWNLFDIVDAWYDMDALHFTELQRLRLITPEGQ